MYKNKRILAIIAARGGSKGLPGKNLKLLAGKPVIVWSIEQALASKAIDRLIVSTEDEEIASVSRRHGADVPFMRPVELATDIALVGSSIIHAMQTLQSMGEHYDIVMLLECTSPVRYPGDIDRAIATLVDSKGAESAVGLVENTHAPPHWNFRLTDGLLTTIMQDGLSVDQCRRQALEKSYVPYCIYLSYWSSFEKHAMFYQPRTVPVILRKEQMVEIDEEFDWLVADTIMKHYILHVYRAEKENSSA